LNLENTHNSETNLINSILLK